MMRGWAALLLVALFAVPVHAGIEDIDFVVTDHFLAPVPSDFALAALACGDGYWVIDGDTLRFGEGETLPTNQPSPLAGYSETACGTAELVLAVPPGNDHLHVDFTSSRRIDTSPGQPTINILEEFRVLTMDNQTLSRVPIRDVGVASTPETAYRLDPIVLPAGMEYVRLQWHFEDGGTVAVSGTTPGATSGVDFGATLSDVLLEFSDVPAGATIESGTERHGNLLREHTRIHASIVPFDNYLPDLRVRAEPHLQFDHVVLPDGTEFDTVATLDQAMHAGFDLTAVQVEQRSVWLQITLPAAFIAEHGPGNYTVVLTSVDTVEIVPALYPVIWVLFLLPIPVAILALVQARRFEREAFGSYKRTARNLRIAVIAVLVYYLAVVLSSLLSNRLDLLVTWPLPAEGWAVYIQVVLAGFAFVLLWTVARELAAITRPKT